jgi:hypothetical protein
MARYIYASDPKHTQIGHVIRVESDGGVELGDDVSFTVAEANIVAWALNKVAEDKQLAVAIIEPNLQAGPYQAIELYDGPTDGVAS